MSAALIEDIIVPGLDTISFENVDFRLFCEPQLVNVVTQETLGEINEVSWYTTTDVTPNPVTGDPMPNVGAAPYIKETITYVRDSGHNAVSRTRLIEYLDAAGLTVYSTTRTKFYGWIAARAEGVRRRQRHVHSVEPSVVGSLLATGRDLVQSMALGRGLLGEIGAGLEFYIRSGEKQLMNAKLNPMFTPTLVTNHLWVSEDHPQVPGASILEVIRSLLALPEL